MQDLQKLVKRLVELHTDLRHRLLAFAKAFDAEPLHTQNVAVGSAALTVLTLGVGLLIEMGQRDRLHALVDQAVAVHDAEDVRPPVDKSQLN